MKKRLGIIQTRGLGDIIVALPIAGYYRDQDWEIYWPILESWHEFMQDTVPWVHWIPIPQDPQGKFFYDVPETRLKNFNCTEILPLYQSLTGHPEFVEELNFQHDKFDQSKYTRAGVPFLHKWQLNKYITRNIQREQDLYNKLVQKNQYCVIHTQGSDHTADFDRSIIPMDWQQITITNQTPNPFDWLLILEQAECLILVDSLFSNLVDQLSLGQERYFLPRSHIQLTPVLGNTWHWLENTNINSKFTNIFRST